MKSFGEIIRKAREDKSLILRKVASKLDIDQAIISKYERGDRKPSKEQVKKFASFYDLSYDDLLIAWLSDKVLYDLENEKLGVRALKVAERRMKYKNTPKK